MSWIAKIACVMTLLTVGVAQYVDRVVASVNGTPILWSDVEEEVRVEALMQGVPVAEITLQQRNESLNRLIDTTLMRRQIRDAHAAVDSEEVSKRLTALAGGLKAQRNAAASDSAWHQLLQEYGLSEADVEVHLREQIVVLDFIDLRFRAGAQTTPKQIEDYYNNEFVPGIKKRAASVPALATVKPQIERILLERAVSEAMDQWLSAVRIQAEIWRASPFDSMSHDVKARD
ncbi:MAG: hypothetical protein NVS9B15_05870 [Acidobacteriaceae bacterium]